MEAAFEGIVSEGPFTVNSTLYPGSERPGYKVYYPADKTSEDLEKDELRAVLNVKELPERAAIMERLIPVFEYLEHRITGDGCQAQYNCEHMYKMCTVAQFFNPCFAAQHLTPEMVSQLAVIKALPHYAMSTF